MNSPRKIEHCIEEERQSREERRFPSHPQQRVGRIPFQIGRLDNSHLDDIYAIEQSSYSLPWSKEAFQGELLNSVSLVLGLMCKGQVVAYSFNHLINDELHILNVAVHPEFRSCRWGTVLLCSLLIQAVRAGARFATLEVRQSNFIAQRLYRTFGFRFVRVRRGYYQDNGEDAFILERKLSNADRVFFEQLFQQLVFQTPS